MKFSTILGLAAASLVSAAPAPGGEDIVIEKFYLRKVTDADNKSTINALSFELSGRKATRLTCYFDDPFYSDPTHARECSRDSKYYFQLLPGTDGSEYRLKILHDGVDGLASGSGNVPSSCYPVGRGPKDISCTQTGPVSISIHDVHT